MKKVIAVVSSCLFFLSVFTGPAPLCAELNENKNLISLDFQNSALSTVLAVMSMKTGKKFITDGELGKKSILFVLKDVTPQDALNALLDTYNLYYVRQPETDIYIIKNRMGGGPIKTVSEVISCSFCPAKGLSELIRSRLGPGGSVGIDERSNSVIVSDVADNIEKIRQMIVQLDKPPFQVLLEAKIVDVKITDRVSYGVSFQDIYRTGNLWVNPWKWDVARYNQANHIYKDALGDGDPGTVMEFGYSKDSNQFFAENDYRSDMIYQQMYNSVTGNKLGLNFMAGDYNISANVGAEKTDGDAKVLSNPRLLVMNGEEAYIDIINQLPYREVTTANGVTTTTIQFKDVGIKLKVKPTINKDKTIVLSVEPEQSFKGDVTEVGVPEINVSKANTVMMIKDGATAVIGGLIREANTATIIKVPLLGDIPILGHLFRKTEKDKTRSELTVFITAKVVE